MSNSNFDETQLIIEEHADHPDEFTKYFKSITTKFGEDKNDYPLNYRLKEYNSGYKKVKSIRQKATGITWQQRGPANVGGRTRGLIIDPDDPNNDTWFAGSATGGIWKTVDRGQTWTCLTDDLPNLSANTLAMAASNHEIIYAGTGESFPGGTYLQGSGIFKSTTRGNSWTQLASTTTEDFEYVNRIVIDPTNENIVLAATESGIMKTIDGGTSWIKVYSSNSGIEDLDADPTNFNNLYGTENSVGVVKSTDGGDNWNLSNNGLEQGSRYELAIAQQDPSKIYLSVNNSNPAAYRSVDYGVNWEKFKDSDGYQIDFLGGQGNYDNTIAVHPYNSDIAFLGGVNLWKVDFSDPGTSVTGSPDVNRFEKDNTSSFMSFISFNATYFDGQLEIGTNNSGTNISMSDFVSVEIRFGPGKTQKAHRFTVGGQGAGVSPSGYKYQNYVDVPFEVWDITNNKQLMVSFRDQEEDGKFDLEARTESDPTVGREYLFINLVDYHATNPSTEIAKDAGHSYKQMYFFWPTLSENGTWDDTNLPDSKLAIGFYGITEKTGTSYVVTDAYGNGDNNYDQGAGFGETSIPGVHPDHHNLIMVKTDEANEKFIVINANDGGLAISENEGVIFNQLPNNYITTQFYGVAKKPGANEYIGGMQDNGTWATPNGVDSDETTNYIFHIGGDGFECAWNQNDPNQLIGSVYYNAFRKSTNGGNSWSTAYSGIEVISSGGQTRLDGPFISRVSSNPYNPDVLFTVGYNGIYKSTDFASNWKKVVIGDGWNAESYVSSKYVTSQHNVEVSLANEDIVWAGAAMSTDNGWNIFVSTDQGESFTAVADFTDADLSGYISGIATHPFEDSTAYILFSFAGEPKVIRTEDLGNTWTDITGFIGSETSSNNFPDVVTNCLVVLPNDPNTIWVGTDIGIFESNNNGATWNYLISDLPAVSVYDMFIQDGQVVIATHGRGIWTATIPELNLVPELTAEYIGQKTIDTKVNIAQSADSIELFVNKELYNTLKSPSVGENNFSIDVANEGDYTIYAKVYSGLNQYQSRNITQTISFTPSIRLRRVDSKNDIKVISTFTEIYDSVEVYLNNNKYSTTITPPAEENNLIVSVTETGTFNIYIKAYLDGVAYQSETQSLYLIFVGINNFSRVNDLKVYPNPSRGIVTIDLPENLNNSYTLNVYSLSGSKVYSKQINQEDNQINLESLRNGMYIIRIEDKGNVYSQKVKIQK